MTRKLDIIVVGTGRCGTKFVSKFLTSAGIPCGHETFFSPGGLPYAEKTLAGHWVNLVADSSWQAVPFLNCEALRDAFVIHLVRHPKPFIESVMKVWPWGGLTPHMRWLVKHVPEIEQYDNEHDRPTWLAYRYVKWNMMIEARLQERDYLRFNVEREPIEILGRLWRKGLVGKVDFTKLFDNRKCNTMHENNPHKVSLDDITDEALRERLVRMAERYGYEWAKSPA